MTSTPTQGLETYALGLLNEEAGEIVQIVGKAMRFGIDTPGPDREPYFGLSARANLEKEAGDMLAALKYARLSGLINGDAVQRHADAKFAKLTDPEAKDNLGRRLAPALPASSGDEDRVLTDASIEALTVPAQDGIEAQNGLNDVFPGDPYPIAHTLKLGLDKLRAEASRANSVPSSEVFRLTDPLMDLLARAATALTEVRS